MKRRRSGAVETPRVALQHPIHCFCCRRIQAKIVTTDRVGAVSRKGNVVTRVLERVTKIAAEVFVRETVSHKVSLLATDQSRVYDGLTDYPHGTVDHRTCSPSAKNYRRSSEENSSPSGIWITDRNDSRVTYCVATVRRQSEARAYLGGATRCCGAVCLRMPARRGGFSQQAGGSPQPASPSGGRSWRSKERARPVWTFRSLGRMAAQSASSALNPRPQHGIGS